MERVHLSPEEVEAAAARRGAEDAATCEVAAAAARRGADDAATCEVAAAAATATAMRRELEEEPVTQEPATLELTTLTEDGLDAVLSWLDPTQLFCQGALVCREWHAAATAPHRRRAAASQRYGAWATAGPVSRWLEAHGHAPRAVLSGSLVVLSAGSNTGPEDWGVPTPPPEAHGQLGRAAAAVEGPCTLRPVGMPGFGIPCSQQVCAVAAGGYHCWALTTAGTAWAWGANAFGMLGLGDRASRQLPQPVALPDAAEAVEVVCGFAFTLVRLGAIPKP